MPSYKLIYFPYAGAAEAIRYIFAYAGQEYEDVRVGYSKEWSELKPKTPFGKLPILEIDGKLITQSNAIARYLAKQYRLAGKDDWEALQADILADTIVDLNTLFYASLIEPNEKTKAELNKSLLETHFPFYFDKFEDMAKSNISGYLVGSNVTWADFKFAAALTDIAEPFPGVLEAYPAIRKAINNIHSIPNIKAWIEKRPPNLGS